MESSPDLRCAAVAVYRDPAGPRMGTAHPRAPPVRDTQVAGRQPWSTLWEGRATCVVVIRSDPTPMYDDYYGHHPTMQLARPVALTGFIGASVDAVGYAISARTGIPFVDLLRWVEHDQGKSVANLVLHHGECSLRDAEAAGLTRALARKPPALISLGHGTLLAPQHVQHLQDAGALLVYLAAPLGDLAARAREQIARMRTKHYPYFTEHSDGAADLEALFAARLPGYLAADITVQSAGQPAQVTAQMVLDILRDHAAPTAGQSSGD